MCIYILYELACHVPITEFSHDKRNICVYGILYLNATQVFCMYIRIIHIPWRHAHMRTHMDLDLSRRSTHIHAYVPAYTDIHAQIVLPDVSD